MLHNHNHNHHLLRAHLIGTKPQSLLGRLYVASFLHDLGLQMLSLFILFYLWEKGWSLPLVVSYLLIFTLLNPFCSRLAYFLIDRWGVVRTMLLSNVARLLFTVALFNLGEPGVVGYGLLALIAVLDILSFRVYYATWDFYFAGLREDKKSGSQTAIAWVLIVVTSALAPLASGFLAQFWGFKTSMVVAGVLMLFSVIPLITAGRRRLATSMEYPYGSLALKRLWQVFRATDKGGLLAFTASNLVFNIFLPLWMLYLAIVIFTDQAYGSLGVLLAASSLLALLATLLAGRLVDRGRYRPLLRVSAWIELLLGGLRFLITGVPLAVVHNFVHQQAWSHNLLVFQWYYGHETDQNKRPAFFQMCACFQNWIHAFVLAVIIVCLFIFADARLEVIKYACIALALSGPLLLGLSLQLKRG